MTAATLAPAKGCEYGCCTPEVAELPDGGWSTNEKGWVIDPRRREHVRRIHVAEMARIDKLQEHHPRCELCGQRTTALDRAGLCPRIDAAHKADRAAWKAAQR